MTRTPAEARAVRIEEALVELLAALDVGGEALGRAAREAAREARSALVQPGQGGSLASRLVIVAPGPHERHWSVGARVSAGGGSLRTLHALMQRVGVPRQAFVPAHRKDGTVLVGRTYRLTDAQMERVREALGETTTTTLNDTP